MYARDPSLIIISATGMFSTLPLANNLRQKGIGDISSRLPGPIKTSQKNQWQKGRKGYLYGCFFAFQVLEGSCLTGLLFNAEAFPKPFKSVTRKGLREAIRDLF